MISFFNKLLSKPSHTLFYLGYIVGVKMYVFKKYPEISGNVSLGDALPSVNLEPNHIVLYDIRRHGVTAQDPPKAYAARYSDAWDDDHVKLPCSSNSLYPIENKRNEKTKRWYLIQSALEAKIETTDQLIEVLLSYNHKYRRAWRFKTLRKLLEEEWTKQKRDHFFNTILPAIAARALDLPNLIKAPIPLLKHNNNISVSLSQLQISSLLANAFFCTFPRRNDQKSNTEYGNYPHINFSTLFDCNPDHNPVAVEKLKCLINYLSIVCCDSPPTGVVTFTRRYVPRGQCPRWSELQADFDIPIFVDADQHIEYAKGLIQLDFANKYLGGGVLGHGSVQEEIRFLAYPELMVSMLFTERMEDTEAVMMIGATRYNNYTGYGHTFEFTGNYSGAVTRDSSHRAETALLAIDALYFRTTDDEFTSSKMIRELNKAWVGFSFPTKHSGMQYPGVATGNWGCGAFHGTPQLKSLLQLMACAQARRPLAYFTFHDEDLRDGLRRLHRLLVNKKITVGALFKIIVKYNHEKGELFDYVINQINKHEPPSPAVNQSPQNPNKTPSERKTQFTSQQNDSPDLFSQDEDQSIHSGNSVKVQKKPNAVDSQTLIESATLMLIDTDSDDNESSKAKAAHDKMASADSQPKMATTCQSHTNMATENQTNQTSRLFEKMQKFDDDNGRLNLPLSTVSKRTNVQDIHSPADDELPTETKKKFAKKITDYFRRNT